MQTLRGEIFVVRSRNARNLQAKRSQIDHFNVVRSDSA
jgi:hypothetical protein